MLSFLSNLFKVAQLKIALSDLYVKKHDLELEVCALEATIKERTRLVDDWGKINTEHKAIISQLLIAVSGK